jgi:1-deoxy-D-xylulose-5-phosphate reductoisomerase
MGKKITVDSATMANKGFEMIEAKWLFGLEPEQISVTIHPESIVHSLVEFCDGSMLGQLAPHSMEYPLSHCLFYPSRERGDVRGINLCEIGKLTFAEPDRELFPFLKLAGICLRDSGNSAAALLGANGVAVDAFLAGRVQYLDIFRVVDEVLGTYAGEREQTLGAAMESVNRARAMAQRLIQTVFA